MSFSIIAIILIAHWVGDFVLQTPEMAVNKNHSLSHLLHHVSFYSFVMFIALLIHFIVINTSGQFPIVNVLYFWVITFITHGATDYFSSKVAHSLSEKQKYYTKIPNFGFFSIIGLDQLIHYLTLFLTYQILFL